MSATTSRTAFFLISVLGITPALSQEKSEPSLYSIALVAGVAEMKRQWGYIDDSYGGRLRTDYHRMIVRKNSEITDDLPLESGEFQFEYLDDESLLGRYRSVKKEFSILEVHPIHNSGTTLKISIAQSWVKSEHGRLSIGISDWADVEFRYDCQQRAYVISAVKLGGI
jgi:hypothetical protein